MNPTHKLLINKQGFSLLEVVISLALVGVLLLMVVPLIVTSVTGTYYTGQDTVKVTQMVSDREIRNLPEVADRNLTITIGSETFNLPVTVHVQTVETDDGYNVTQGYILLKEED